MNDNPYARDSGQRVRNRHEEQLAVQSHPDRQKQRKSHAEHDLTQHRYARGQPRFAHRLQKDERALVDTRERRQQHDQSDRSNREIRIMDALIRRAEYADQQPRTAFYDERGDRANGGLAEQQQPLQIEA